MRRCLLLFIFAWLVRAEETSPGYQFLFVIDTSISMAERKNSVLANVGDLVRGGFARQIEPGDIVSVWSSDIEDRLHHAPAAVWDPEKSEETVNWAVETVRAQKFHRGSHLSPVLADLGVFLPTVKAAFIVILTDADEPISGIPLEAEINNHLIAVRRHARRTKQPIVLSLVALDGKITDWRAYTGSGTPLLPRLPARPKPAPEPEPAKPAEPVEPLALPATNLAPRPPAVFDLPPGAKIVPLEAASSEIPAPKVGTLLAPEASGKSEPLPTEGAIPASAPDEAKPQTKEPALPLIADEKQLPATVETPVAPGNIETTSRSDLIAVTSTYSPDSAPPVQENHTETPAAATSPDFPPQNREPEAAPRTADTPESVPSPSFARATAPLPVAELPTHGTNALTIAPVLKRAPEPSAPTSHATYMMCGTGGLLILATGLFLLKRGKPANQGSIISKSMAR